MKQLLDFLPILLFFAAFKFYDIYVGTAVLMAATTIQMAVVYAMERRLQTMQKATLALILVFGALTLLLHDERFIKWKPTVLYTAMALALAVAVWGLKKNFLKMMLGGVLEGQLVMPDNIWMRLNIAWILYFFFMAALNAYVVVNFSTEAWMNFKIWGYVLPLAFLLAQFLYISPYFKGEDGDKPTT